MLTRRRTLQLAAAGMATIPNFAWAQAWPGRSIRAIIPYTPGGASDINARIVFEQLAKQLGQPIVVENRPGASGSIGAAVVAKSEPDGYNIVVNSASFTIAAVMLPSLPYDSANDFSAVASLGTMPSPLMVSPRKGYKSVRDLVEAAQKNPGAMSYGSIGVGSTGQLCAELFKLDGKFEAFQVPYKGAPEALLDLLSGRIDFVFSSYLPAKPFIDDRSLTALAVPSRTRAAALPDVPTLVELGYPKTDYPYWNALFVPAKTPRTIVNKLHDETVKAVVVVKDKLAELGIEPDPASPSELDAMVRKQIAVNAELIKVAGIK
jgi:tripartite-type tricarboxylate transporter receptor subunit TctC